MRKNIVILSISGIILIFLFLYLNLYTIDDSLRVDVSSDDPIFVKLTGYSMYPTIKDGDLKPCSTENDYSIGDIVSFYGRNKIISHRIIGEFFDGYVTKGDNNMIPDMKLVNLGDIVCKVVLN